MGNGLNFAWNLIAISNKICRVCLLHLLICSFIQDEESRNKDANRPELFKAMQKRNISIAQDEEDENDTQNADNDQAPDDGDDGVYTDDEYSDEDVYSDDGSWSKSQKVSDLLSAGLVVLLEARPVICNPD